MASNAVNNVKNNATKAAQTSNDDLVMFAKKNDNVIQKDYVLNELEALKKKLDNEHLKPEISVSNQASDGSNVVISMKTSLYEFMKVNLMDAFNKDCQIVHTKAVKKAIAITHFHEKADIEFQLKIIFRVGENQHKVKVLCYSTTCRMMIQQMGESVEVKEHLNNKTIAIYFAEKFLVDFGKTVLVSNPKIEDSFIPKLKQEIKRLQQLFFKNKKKDLKPLPKSMKCETFTKCKKGGNITTNNVDVYAQCTICDGCEHYICASIKGNRRENIINGVEKFVCTICFTKNPTLATEVNKLTTKDQTNTKIVTVDVHDEILLVETEEITINTTKNDVNKTNINEGFWNLEETQTEQTVLNYSCDECEDKFLNSDELKGHKDEDGKMKKEELIFIVLNYLYVQKSYGCIFIISHKYHNKFCFICCFYRICTLFRKQYLFPQYSQ